MDAGHLKEKAQAVAPKPNSAPPRELDPEPEVPAALKRLKPLSPQDQLPCKPKAKAKGRPKAEPEKEKAPPPKPKARKRNKPSAEDGCEGEEPSEPVEPAQKPKPQGGSAKTRAPPMKAMKAPKEKKPKKAPPKTKKAKAQAEAERKKKCSRKSSAYHAAIKQARLDGKGEEEARTLAKAVSWLSAYVCAGPS